MQVNKKSSTPKIIIIGLSLAILILIPEVNSQWTRPESNATGSGFTATDPPYLYDDGTTIFFNGSLLDDSFVNVTGDIMTGNLIINSSNVTLRKGNIIIDTASLVASNGLWLDGSNTAGAVERTAGIRGVVSGTNDYVSVESNLGTIMQIGRVGGSARVNLVGGSFMFAADNGIIGVGTSEDAGMRYSTSQTPDSWQFGTSADSNAIIIMEKADIGAFDFAHPLQTEPTIFIQSQNQNTSQWLSLKWNAINFSTGASISSNSTCLILRSPNGLTTSTVCN